MGTFFAVVLVALFVLAFFAGSNICIKKKKVSMEVPAHLRPMPTRKLETEQPLEEEEVYETDPEARVSSSGGRVTESEGPQTDRSLIESV